MELSVLKMKCGSIWRRSAPNCARESSALRRASSSIRRATLSRRVHDEGHGQYQGVSNQINHQLFQERGGPDTRESRMRSEAPRIDERLKLRRPCPGHDGDGGKCRQVHGECLQLRRSGDLVSAREGDDERRRQRPWQPGDKLGDQKGHPDAVGMFLLQHEHGQACVDQRAGAPDCSNPEQTGGTGAGLVMVGIIHQRGAPRLIDAANCLPYAVSGLGPRRGRAKF